MAWPGRPAACVDAAQRGGHSLLPSPPAISRPLSPLKPPSIHSMSYGVCIPSVATAAALAAAGRHITSSGFKISPPSAILAADAVFNRNGTSVAFIWAASEGGGGGDVHAAVARAAKAAATFRHVFLLAPAPAAADEAEVACG